jgi:hypothetical protein
MLANQIMDLPDPDMILMKLGLGRSQLRKLTFDDEIYQCIETREDGLQRVPVRLEPTESAAGLFIAKRCLTPMFKRRIISGAFKALLYGWSVQEIVWDEGVYEREGVFVPRDISERNLEYFAVRPEGVLVQNVLRDGLGQHVVRVPQLQKSIKDLPGAEYSWVVMDTKYKFLLTRNKPTWDNPFGEALLSRLYWPWFFRNTAWQFFVQYLERYAIPILVGSIPADSEMTAERLAELLMKAHQDAVIGTKGGSVTAVNLNNTGHELYRNVEELLVRRIQKVVLGQTLTSGTDGGSGNRALGEVHNEVRKDKTDSDIGLVIQTVQTFVNACFELNGFTGEPPEVIFGDEVNLAMSRAQRDQILIQSGIVGGFSEDYLLDNYGFRPGEFRLPEVGVPGRVDEVIEVEREGEGEGEKREGARLSMGFAGGGGKGGERERIERTEFVMEMLSLWGAMKAGSPILATDILRVVMESESAGELVDRLSEVVRKMRPDFGEQMYDTNEVSLVMGEREIVKGRES